MKVGSKIILGNVLRVRESLLGNGLAEQYAVDEPPLRSELFSADQMEQHGKTLAGLHTLSLGRAPDQLLARLARERKRPDRSPRSAGGGGEGEPPDYAGRGMAAR